MKQFTKGTSSKTSVDFVKTKRKVGKKIKKSNNTNEDAKVTSKRVNVLEQSVAANLSNDGTLRTKRGTGMQELVNRTTHHAGKTRKEALEGMLELLSEFKQEALLSRRNGGSADANAVCGGVREVRGRGRGREEERTGVPERWVVTRVSKRKRYFALRGFDYLEVRGSVDARGRESERRRAEKR